MTVMGNPYPKGPWCLHAQEVAYESTTDLDLENQMESLTAYCAETMTKQKSANPEAFLWFSRLANYISMATVNVLVK